MTHGGSWVVRSMVLGSVTLFITLLRILRTLFYTALDPASRLLNIFLEGHADGGL